MVLDLFYNVFGTQDPYNAHFRQVFERKHNKTNAFSTFCFLEMRQHNKTQQILTIDTYNKESQQRLTMDTDNGHNRRLPQALTIDTHNGHLQQTLTIDTYNRYKPLSVRVLCWDNLNFQSKADKLFAQSLKRMQGNICVYVCVIIFFQQGLHRPEYGP